jgi:hypothetical protein
VGKSKRTILIFVLPLILCLVGTFVLLKLNQNQVVNDKEAGVISGQTNFLVIQIDNLKNETPKLLSAWMILVRVDQPNYVIFKEIVTTQPIDSGDRSSLIEISLDAAGLPTQSFLTSIQQFDLDIDSYILLDADGITALTADFIDQSPDVFSGLNESIINQLCVKLNQSSKKQPADQDFWNNLIPLHLRTNLSFETFATLWEKLTRSEASPICKIIPLNSQNASIP